MTGLFSFVVRKQTDLVLLVEGINFMFQFWERVRKFNPIILHGRYRTFCSNVMIVDVIDRKQYAVSTKQSKNTLYDQLTIMYTGIGMSIIDEST